MVILPLRSLTRLLAANDGQLGNPCSHSATSMLLQRSEKGPTGRGLTWSPECSGLTPNQVKMHEMTSPKITKSLLMRKLLIFIFCRLVVPAFRLGASVFFDEQYLRGRYFDRSLIGWRWVLRAIILQKILGFNRHVMWPIAPANSVDEPHNVFFDPNDLQNFMHHGCYFSNVGGGKITIGKGTMIAPNCGIITTNHRLNEIDRHEEPQNVTLGENCWLGMNAVILPGVSLGANTVVAAGAVVNTSHPEGWCVLGGTPAKVLKLIPHPNLPLVEHLADISKDVSY